MVAEWLSERVKTFPKSITLMSRFGGSLKDRPPKLVVAMSLWTSATFSGYSANLEVRVGHAQAVEALERGQQLPRPALHDLEREAPPVVELHQLVQVHPQQLEHQHEVAFKVKGGVHVHEARFPQLPGNSRGDFEFDLRVFYVLLDSLDDLSISLL